MEQEKVQYTQSEEKRFEIFVDYFKIEFPVKFPHLEIPYSEDGLTTLCPPSAVILAQVFSAEPTLTRGFITSRLAQLDSQGLLVRKQKVVFVEKQPSAAEKTEAERKAKREAFEKSHAAGLLNSARHNKTELDDEFDHGKAQPLPLTEQQRVALNEKNRRDDAIIADVTSRITNYTGATHSKTYAGRDALNQTFTDAMNRGLSAEQVQKEVEAKLNSMTSNNSVR